MTKIKSNSLNQITETNLQEGYTIISKIQQGLPNRLHLFLVERSDRMLKVGLFWIYIYKKYAKFTTVNSDKIYLNLNHSYNNVIRTE